MDPSLGQTTEPYPKHIAGEVPSPVANASMFIITNDEGFSLFSYKHRDYNYCNNGQYCQNLYFHFTNKLINISKDKRADKSTQTFYVNTFIDNVILFDDV